MTPNQEILFNFNTLHWCKFEFVTKVETPIILPEYKGSTFRGAMGLGLHKILCPNHKPVGCNCIYSHIFEPKTQPEYRKSLQIGGDAPRGYILEPPETKQKYFEKDEIIKFNLILVGRMIHYLPYFVLIFEQIGKVFGLGFEINKKRGKFNLINVNLNDENIFSADSGNLNLKFSPTYSNNLKKINSPSKVSLNFLTPTRFEIRNNRVLPDKPDDSRIFLINLYRHLFLLNAIYCDGEKEYSHALIEEKSANIILNEAHLSIIRFERLARQKRVLFETHQEENIDKTIPPRVKMNYDGFVGSLRLSGDINPFLDMLALGEQLHVGKYPTFGFGKYEII